MSSDGAQHALDTGENARDKRGEVPVQQVAVVGVHSHRHSSEHRSESADDTSFCHVRVHDVWPQFSQRAYECEQ